MFSYEMNEEEGELWEALKRVHRENFKPGAPLKALNQVKFVGSHIEEGLEMAAKEKEQMERIELDRQRAELKAKNKDDGDADQHVIMMIGNGLGVFQIIASRGGIFIN
jgi:phosphoglucomutase